MTAHRRPRPVPDEPLAKLKAWYPAKRPPPPEGTFEIALVIAGGQSAGCYAAGVLDFLFEALDSWAVERAKGGDIPNHKVRIEVMVGASAGGLNAILASIAGRFAFRPARAATPEDDTVTSPFYRAWVQDIDITHLLAVPAPADGGAADDGSPETARDSLLNSAYLVEKVRDYIGFRGEGVADAGMRDWLADPLPVKVTVANLDGVPYDVGFAGAGTTGAHHMRLHQDHVAFERALFQSPTDAGRPDHTQLALENAPDDAAWQSAGVAALSTIAFPVLFSEQRIHRPNTDYDYRFAYFHTHNAPVYAESFPERPRAEVSFPAVDGGTLNNEPFGLAHDALAGTAGYNPRDGDAAYRAVILIDPFTDAKAGEVDAKAPWTIERLAKRLVAAIASESRFKHIDLALAQSGSIYSRFMIAPVRRAGQKRIHGDRALASRPLMALMGYFAAAYRHHDFMLGRVNAYRFLRDWFVLPAPPEAQPAGPDREAPEGAGARCQGPDADNQARQRKHLFAFWSDDARRNPAFASRTRPGHLQIIPLMGTAAEEPQDPEWPAHKFAGFDAVSAQVRARTSAVYPDLRAMVASMFTDGAITGFLVRRIVDTVWYLGGRRALLAFVARKIDAARDDIDRPETP